MRSDLTKKYVRRKKYKKRNDYSSKRINSIVNRVSFVVNTEFELDLFSKTRKVSYIYARAIFYKVLYENYNMSLEQIGDTVEKNHASISNSLNKIRNSIDIDEDVKHKYFNVLVKLKFISVDKVNLLYKKKEENKPSVRDKLYDLIDDIPDNKMDFYYEKIKNFIKYY